jgi:RNA polymerase sigma-70 factor (ECF subfamily)
MDEPTLVRAARKGDRGAFGELVGRYARAVLARQVACTHELSFAEDLAQETFVRAWQGLGRLEDERAFGSWLLSIAGFVSAEWIRRKRTAERRLAPRGEPVTETRREPDLPLAEAVATLGPEAQQLLALRHGQGLSCDEIARELGRPIGSVTKALSRAYAELRERLVRT